MTSMNSIQQNIVAAPAYTIPVLTPQDIPHNADDDFLDLEIDWGFENDAKCTSSDGKPAPNPYEEEGLVGYQPYNDNMDDE